LECAFPPELVLLEPQRRIDPPSSPEQTLRTLGEVEPNRIEPVAPLTQYPLEMSMAHDLWLFELHIAYAEYRGRITHPTWFQIPAEPLEVIGGIVKIDQQVDALFGTQGVGLQVSSGDLMETLPELVEPVSRDREPPGHLVTAVAVEQVSALDQRGVKVEPRDASSGSLPRITVKRDEEGGTSVPFNHTRRDDSHHAWVPALTAEYDRRISGRVEFLLDEIDGLIENPRIEVLAFRVSDFESICELRRLRRVVGKQKAESVGRFANPAGRVESRG
jgi:hypothetical protein